MAYTLMVGNQKGGVAKTVTSAIIGYLLRAKYRVLLVDLDPQGSLTEMYTGKPIRDYRLEGYEGIKFAMEDEDVRQHILRLNDNLDLAHSDEDLGAISQHIWSKPVREPRLILRRTLAHVADRYDFIVIDTPPNLGDLLTNAFNASDGVVALFDCASFTYSALFSFFETLEGVRNISNPGLHPLGILCTLLEVRRSDMQDYLQLIKEHEKLGPLCFDTVIRRSAATGRLSYAGFFDNPEVDKAVAQYKPFMRELMARVSQRQSNKN